MKITIKSKIAASNLLSSLHSLYQLGHLCDTTIETEYLGVREEFSVHRAVLAASSNYFKELFLSDELSDIKNCTVAVSDICSSEFTSFLEFVYTAKVELELEQVHRMKEVAEKLECMDLLRICEEIKPEVKEGCLNACKYMKGGNGESSWVQVQEVEAKKSHDSVAMLVAHMNLTGKESPGDRPKHHAKKREAFAGLKVVEFIGDRTACTGDANQIEAGNKKEREINIYVPNHCTAKETCIDIRNLQPDYADDESRCCSEHPDKNKQRRSPRNPLKRLSQTYTCDMCNQSFHLLNQYQSHMGTEHHINTASKYHCHIGSHLFSSHQNLRQHRQTVHSEERHFRYSHCNKRFKLQKDRKGHIQSVHETKRILQACPHCGKVISSKYGLTVHKGAHTGEKPYTCQHCTANFAQRSAYNTHVRKIHILGQDKKSLPVYWKTASSGNTSDHDVDTRSSHEPRGQAANTGIAQSANEKGITDQDVNPASSSDAEEDCQHEVGVREDENGKEDSRVEEREDDEDEEGEEKDEENEDELSINGSEDADTDAGYSEAEEVRKDNDNVCSDEDFSIEKDAEDDESDEDFKIKKVGGTGITKRSTYIIKCDKCIEEFVSRKNYVDHCKDVHQCLPGKVYRCDVCSKSFASYNSWKEHKACVHTEERQFACTLCSATFKRKRDVRTHYMRKHEGRVRRPLCSVCGKILSSRTALVFHMRTHTGEKPYECGICHSRFAQPSQLKIHTRSHTGEKPYICEDCGACFADKGKLNGHKRTHTGERLFKCDVCGKHFATKEYLKCHKRCHMGAKPYKCDVCGKTFGLRASLAQHSNVHAETRPYFCEQCGKTFTQPGALRRHQRIHTGEKPYKCRACERTFTDMSTLRRHVSIHDRNAHWRSFLIDLTIKKDHNWSKIETLSDACIGEDSSSEIWSVDQEKLVKRKPEAMSVKDADDVPSNSKPREKELYFTHL